jgi:hypothetical protein
MLTYDTPTLRQTGSRNLTGQKTLLWSQASYRYLISWEAFLNPSDSYFLFAHFVDFSTHWTYMLIFRRIFLIYKCMLNVYKNQQNRQTGSRNLMGPKTLPTIWGTYMKLVTKYLDPSDSYFLFAELVGFCTHWTYMHIFRHIFLSNYWWQNSDIWSQASYRYPILWEAFLDPSCDQISDLCHQ